MPDAHGSNASVLLAVEEGMSKNVHKDLGWLEAELGRSQGKFFFGDTLTAADCNLSFSVDYILARQLGTQGKKWKRIEQYLKDCQATATYKKAIEKTSYHL
ncbi:hypothetical protein MMC10_000520 [Thelotrema lepadinum]|nr:hypothetical protein [Thelotrema lepadinum]